jgi:hypothetical protein
MGREGDEGDDEEEGDACLYFERAVIHDWSLTTYTKVSTYRTWYLGCTGECR